MPCHLKTKSLLQLEEQAYFAGISSLCLRASVRENLNLHPFLCPLRLKTGDKTDD